MKVIEILQKFPQWEAIPYAADFACQECGKSAIQGKDEYGNPTKEKPNLVGWCETNNGFMAVFECPCCHSKFRFHPQMEYFNLDQLDFYLGAYYIGDGDSIWIANAKELSDKLDKEESVNKENKFIYPNKLYARCKDNKTLDMSYAPQNMEAVEYTRTDAFIEKACEWLKESITNNPECNRIISKKGAITMGELIDDFKKYMKG